MKIKKSVIGLGLIGVLSVGLIAFDVIRDKTVVREAEAAYSNEDPATYYANVDLSSGEALLSSLQTLNSQKRRGSVAYSSMFNSGTNFYKTDPGTSSGQITAFYSGKSMNKSGMNREHVWPDSRLATKGEAHNDPLENDIHMVRPADSNDNSSRGNDFFVELGSAGWDPAECGNASYRGDAARIIFYCVAADSRLSLVDAVSAATSANNMGKLSNLLKWNIQYPVSNREITRNTEAEKLQGNKNPFIDHPEYACKIWGNTNPDTRAICAGQQDPVQPTTGISVDIRMSKADGTYYVMPSTYSMMDLSDYVLLYPFVNNKIDAGATWRFFNTNGSDYDGPATISKNADGSVKINSDKKTAIKIMASKDAESYTIILYLGMKAPSNGCGGNIAITSSIIATLSAVGIALLLIKKFQTK